MTANSDEEAGSVSLAAAAAAPIALATAAAPAPAAVLPRPETQATASLQKWAGHWAVDKSDPSVKWNFSIKHIDGTLVFIEGDSPTCRGKRLFLDGAVATLSPEEVCCG